MANRHYRMRNLESSDGRPGVVPACARTIWRWVQNDQFPKPFRLNGMAVWDADEVDEFLRACAAEGAA